MVPRERVKKPGVYQGERTNLVWQFPYQMKVGKIKFGTGPQRYIVGLKYLCTMWRNIDMQIIFVPAFCQVIF